MKTIVKQVIRDEKGKVLIMVLVLLVLGGLVLTPLLGMMSTGLASGQVYEKKTHEYYAADAGVEDAIWKIMNDVDELPNSSCGNQTWSYNYTIPDVNVKNVQVAIDYSGNYTHLITSTATSNDGSSTTVQAHITLDVETMEGEGFFDSDWVVVEDGNFEWGEETTYDGDVQVIDGNVVLGDGATIDGNVWSGDGDVVLGQGATITGSVLSHGGTGHKVELQDGAVIEGTVCAQYIILKVGSRIVGTAYATCADSDQMCHTPYVPCDESGTQVVLEENAIIEGSAYSENGDVEILNNGAQIWGDAYAANEVKVGGGGSVGGTIYNGFEDWLGCPLCGTTSSSTITGVSIGYWQIS